jgi:hypothetical protein
MKRKAPGEILIEYLSNVCTRIIYHGTPPEYTHWLTMPEEIAVEFCLRSDLPDLGKHKKFIEDNLAKVRNHCWAWSRTGFYFTKNIKEQQ